MLGGSPLRIAPTHGVQSNPPFLCILLSVGVLRVPIIYGFYAPEAFFVIIVNRSLRENAMVEAAGGSERGDVRGGRWGTTPTSPRETRCHGWVVQKQTLRQGLGGKLCV